MDLETKALLLSVGTVQVAEPRAGGRASTAGPGAGGQSVFFQSGPHIARLSVAESSPLRLESRDGGRGHFNGRPGDRPRPAGRAALALPGAGLHHSLGALHLRLQILRRAQIKRRHKVRADGLADGRGGRPEGQPARHLPDQRRGGLAPGGSRASGRDRQGFKALSVSPWAFPSAPFPA